MTEFDDDTTQQQDDEAKTDREDGGPVAGEDAPEIEDPEGVHGTKESPFEPHE